MKYILFVPLYDENNSEKTTLVYLCENVLIKKNLHFSFTLPLLCERESILYHIFCFNIQIN